MSKPTKKQLEKLAQGIKSDQDKASPAEKRVKIKTSFQKAVKKWGKRHQQKRGKIASFFIW